MEARQAVRQIADRRISQRETRRYYRGMEQLVTVVQELSLARNLDTVMAIVKQAARELTGADGATFVLRDRNMCYYAEENAIAPLWKGQRFPMNICIGGWTMLNRQPVQIEDIYADTRIPYQAYRSTFVKSLVMVPIRTLDPIGAIGNYWAKRHQPSPEEVKLLQALADTTAVALENIQVYAELEQRVVERTAELQTAYKELATLADNVPALVARVDRNLRHIFVNQPLTEVCGIPKEQFLGKTFRELKLSPQVWEVWESGVCQVFAVGIPKEVEFPFVSPDGVRYYCTRFVPEFDANGSVETVLGVTYDITESKRTEEEIRRLSLTDDMTGLHNRRGFFLLTEQQLKVARRVNTCCALIFVDLDGLKKINDTLGHDLGSAMIVDAAQLLKSTFREADVVARLGGDEFIILALNCGDSCHKVESRIIAKIDEFNRQEKRPYKLSMSVGILPFDPQTRESLESLVARTDALMYEHKRAKRQCLVS
ncbi:diguanylate cyclase domain-containing protein [Aerosakkonema sp. BLCC-F183]|uniref:sensor domain-containing diguanylate cyclase n=1 Tax=Aerosakkonema sp. BLCC-F183 TaxID=3342834 RepID=UPI0035BB6683